MLFELAQIESIGKFLGGVITTAVAAFYAFKKAKEKYIAGVQAQEAEVQRRVEAVRKEDDDRITRLKEISEEWKAIAEQRKVKLDETQAHITKLEEELKELRVEHLKLLKANSELILRVQRLEQKTLDKGE